MDENRERTIREHVRQGRVFNEDARDLLAAYDELKASIGPIADERVRQIHQKGFDQARDMQYERGELLLAATAYMKANASALYVAPSFYEEYKDDPQIGEYAANYRDDPLGVFFGRDSLGRVRASTEWPHNWDAAMFKPSEDPVRNCAKAGALVAAEISRLTAVRCSKDPEVWCHHGECQ